MGIYTGGRSRAINSPRHLTLRHARRTAYHYRKAINTLLLGEEDEGPDLLPGQEKLNSYWAPSLLAGPEYTITAEQTVETSDDSLLLTSKQPFVVDAPRFSLPEGSVYSIYPPSGYSVENRILPHVVLNDPHLPWERVGSPSTIEIEDPRNRVPWLVLFSFTQDELRLEPGCLKGYDPKQTATLSVKMTVGEIRAISNVATPFTSSVSNDTVGEFVFIKPDLFKSLFSTFDKENRRVDKNNPDVDQYKYLSHVRKINTTGMAIAGTEDVGIFSVVVGNRAGPLHNRVPVTVAVHLLSIEGVEKMEFPSLDKDYISLCSLHSWNYTVLPPDTLNVHDTFVELGKTLSVLRPPQALVDTVRDKTSRVRERLARRLEDGYSLVKYRTQTGEPTMAFYRSPFTPTVVVPIPQFATCSNSGQDFQILDQELGIMDVTYSSAWHIGRVLAAGDQSFTAALTRFRGAIHRMAFKDAKLAAVKMSENSVSFRIRKDVLLDLKNMVNMLGRIHQPHLRNGDVENSDDDQEHDGGHAQSSPQPENRWYRPRLSKAEFLPLGLYNPTVQDTYLDSAIAAARQLAKAKDGTMYDETNNPVSTDWMAILAWVMDRKFLSGVPAHYLISDPSHLESESLNFFYIDPNWVDALIDGALSLGNEQGTDIIRQAIKTIINDYVDAVPISLSHRPQIPTYGFYLRSDIVTMYPDLKVDTLPTHEGERPKRAPLLRHEIVADGIMLGLFDRVPGSDEFTGLTFTQPSHQQVFAAANSLTADKATINIRKQYTVPMDIRKGDSTRHHTLEPTIDCTPGKADSLFLWNTVPKSGREADETDPPTLEDDLRAIKTPEFAKRQLDMLNDPERGVGTYTDPDGHSKKYFDDETPNSALFAMQLTDPIWFLEIPFQKKGGGLPIPALASLQPQSSTLAAALQAGDSGVIGKQEVRKLHSLKHSVVPPLYPRPPNLPGDERVLPKRFFVRSTSRVASDGNTGAGHAAPLTHAPADAPHIRPIITTESLEPMALHSQLLSYRTPYQPRPGGFDTSTAAGPAMPPEFDCRVYSPQLDDVLLDKNELRQDLIFSVLVKCPHDNQYALKEFQIVVPLGSPTTTNQNTLMESYDGPGPRMLSNLRFNVLTSITTIDHRKLLSLRLVPRSSSGYITMKSDFELGFLLCLAKLNVYKYSATEIELTTSAHYVYPHEETLTGKFTVVVLKDGSGV